MCGFISLASIGEHDIHPTSPSTFCYRIVSVGFCVLSYYVFVHGVSRITLPRNERWNKVDVNSYNIVQSWCSLPGATDMQLLIMQDCQSLVIGDTTLTTLSILLQTIETHLLISSIITTKTMIYFRFANVLGLMLLVGCTRHMINSLSNIRRIIVIPTITACQYIFCPLSHRSIWIVWCWYRCW